MSRLRNPQNPLHSPDPLQVWKTFCGWCTHSQALPCPIVLFQPQKPSRTTVMSRFRKNLGRIGTAGPETRRNASWTPTAAPQKDNVIKSQWSQKTFWLGNLHQIRMFLGAFHHQSWMFWMPRHQSGPSHLAIVPPIAILPWSILCRGPALMSYPLRRMRPRRWAISSGVFIGRNPTGWPAVDRNPQKSIEIQHLKIEKMAVKRWLFLPSSLWYLPRFLGGWDSFLLALHHFHKRK